MSKTADLSVKIQKLTSFDGRHRGFFNVVAAKIGETLSKGQRPKDQPYLKKNKSFQTQCMICIYDDLICMG